jgi:membrane-associated protease RseP (regulator of RpoE activity)
MPEPGPLGETFFEARERAMTGALFVKRSLGGCVESVVTLRTQSFFGADFFFEAEDFFAARRWVWVAIAVCLLMPLEVLDGALVLLCLFTRRKSAEVAALARGGILFAGIETIFAGFELADHIEKDAGGKQNEASGNIVREGLKSPSSILG